MKVMLLSCPLETCFGLIKPVESVNTQLNVQFIVPGLPLVPPVQEVRINEDELSFTA